LPINPAYHATSPQHARASGIDARTIDAGCSGFFDLVHPDDSNRIQAAIKRLFEDGRPYNEEFRVLAPDGSYTWLHGRAVDTYEWEGELCDAYVVKPVNLAELWSHFASFGLI
jgi:PAS domain-containing protein